MAKRKKNLTEEEKYEMQLQLESDLSRTQRQFKVMERYRDLLVGGTTKNLKRLRKVGKVLKSEYTNVQNDLNVALAYNKIIDDRQKNRKLNDLLKEHDSISSQIKAKKEHLKEIDLQMIWRQKQVVKLQSKIITDEQFQRRVSHGQRTLETLENKLCVQTVKFCTILAKNRKMREEIEHLILERNIFNRTWEKMVSNLYLGKKFMLDLIEQATIAYDQREEWCAKLTALRAKITSDLAVQTTEMRELQGKINHQAKLRDFITIKCQKRILRDLENIVKNKLEHKRQEMQKIMKDYTTILYNVFEFVGSANLGVVVRQYKVNEEKNYSDFTQIITLQEESEQISEELQHLRSEIDKKQDMIDNWRERQANNLNVLKENYEKEVELTNQEREKLQETEMKLQTLIKGVREIFLLINCKNDSILQLLGDNTTINIHNIQLYLRVIETKIDDLLVINCYKESELDKKKVKGPRIIDQFIKPTCTIPLEKLVPTNPCPLCVQHEQVSDVIDTLQFALTREEQLVKLEKRLGLPGGLARLHNVSACHLPESRQIIQKRYQ